ncbi:hypothetical protein Tsp_11530 [Trichinella spiralis]|uniref:hypothetical protein n=1 Tax=Trichinella spiralis TaxID=6334 RepID=UPI0001EFE321|nr:hypothetical protein Tsp_11530 [Trichinella spiralis]
MLVRRQICKKRVEADDMHGNKDQSECLEFEVMIMEIIFVAVLLYAAAIEDSDGGGYSVVISAAVVPLDVNSLSMAAWSEKPNKENAFQRPINWYNKGYAFSKIINKSKEAKNNPIKLPLLTVGVFI